MSHPKIAPQVLAELNRQLNQELAAAYSYHALSLWCADENLIGFASFFAKQSAEEREHAGKIADHLLDRDSRPKLDAITAPKQNFKSLLDIAQQAQAMEHANTQGINMVYEAAVAAKDYPAQVLMHWFINEQVEEEAWCTQMIQRVQAASCAGGLSELDRHIDRYLTKGGGEK